MNWFSGQSFLGLKNFLKLDWILIISVILLASAGLVTMNSFSQDSSFFGKQLIWLTVSLVVFFVFSTIDWRFLRRTNITVTIFFSIVILLFAVFVLGITVKGAERWLSFGLFSFQPSDPAKIALIILLSKYFTRRHVEIAHFKHILVSGFYAFILFVLIFLQPNFSTAIVIGFIWFGMVMISGISKKHIFAIIALGAISFAFLWFFVLHDYQKERIVTFVDPLADARGAGYNALQSMIAVGSGQLVGKGIGFGTQSRLRFLPEYQTDFIFASFAEEWGFVGVIILISLFGIVIWRIIYNAIHGASNFEILFGAGVAVWFVSHFAIHLGMNVGLLPVTGITLPFVSYGGSHLLTEFAALGILMGMRRYSRTFHKSLKDERQLI